MRSSYSEANLPKLPGVKTYVPRRTNYARVKYFDVGADGVQLEAQPRPTTSPGRFLSSTRSLLNTRSTSRLRPMSAVDLRASESVQSLIDEQHQGMSAAATNALSRTQQRKDQVLSSLRQLEPLSINQQRVALQQQLRSLEEEEKSMIKENLAPAESRRLLRSNKSELALAEPPRWVKFSREVLRFYLYFKEAVPESAFETERIRKCVLYYYLEDGTCRLNEPKIKNSGISGGDILGRAVFKRADGQAYAPLDFTIGSEISLAGKVFRVVDADVNTRNYFSKAYGQDLGPAEETPGDNFTKQQEYRAQLNPKESRRITNEALLGGRPGLYGYKVTKDLHQQMKNEGKQLRFKAIWDDSDRLYGGRNEYSLIYHLQDDEIEIRNKKTSDGRDPFPFLVKKGRLPRDFESARNIPDNPLGRNEEKYYTDRDLICGRFVQCYGRELLLVSCDRETERYYAREHGIQQVPVFVKPNAPPVIKHEIPPYNGWGSEQDSLASCMSLVPTAVQRDMLRFMENQGKTLRFKAKFLEPKNPSDAERRFVFTFYLEDETMSIFEPPIRNSGIVGGKFLERGKYKLAVRAKRQEEINPNGVRDNHPLVKLLKEKMSQYMSGGNYMLLNAFKHFGGIGGGESITLTEFQHGCRMCGMVLSRKDAKTLFQFYDADNSGSINFHEFVDGIMDDQRIGKFGTDAAKSTGRWIRPSDFYTGAKVKIMFPRNGAETDSFVIEGCDEYTTMYREMHPHEFPKSNVEFIVRELATKLQQFNVNVRQVFKSYDTTGTGRISHEQFKTLLRKWAKDFGFVDDELSEQDAITLVRHYDDDDDGSISIAEFCDALTAAPIAFRDQVDETHVEGAERRMYNALHNLPPGELRKRFNSMDTRGDGHITVEAFEQFIQGMGISLNEHEVAALFLHYDPKGLGYFEYETFAAFVEADHFISTRRKERTKKQTRLRTKSMHNYMDILEEKRALLTMEQKLGSLMKDFCRFFYPRRVMLRKAFLSHDNEGKGVVCKCCPASPRAARASMSRPHARYPSSSSLYRSNLTNPQHSCPFLLQPRRRSSRA